MSPGESSRHRSNHHPHHHDYTSSGDEAIDDAEEDYMAAAEAAIAALGSRVDSRCRSFRDCKPLLIHNSSGTATREFRRAPIQVNNNMYLYSTVSPCSEVTTQATQSSHKLCKTLHSSSERANVMFLCQFFMLCVFYLFDPPSLLWMSLWF